MNIFFSLLLDFNVLIFICILLIVFVRITSSAPPFVAPTSSKQVSPYERAPSEISVHSRNNNNNNNNNNNEAEQKLKIVIPSTHTASSTLTPLSALKTQTQSQTQSQSQSQLQAQAQAAVAGRGKLPSLGHNIMPPAETPPRGRLVALSPLGK